MGPPRELHDVAFLIEKAQKSRIEESPGYAVPRFFRRMAHRQMLTREGARSKLRRFLQRKRLYFGVDEVWFTSCNRRGIVGI